MEKQEMAWYQGQIDYDKRESTISGIYFRPQKKWAEGESASLPPLESPEWQPLTDEEKTALRDKEKKTALSKEGVFTKGKTSEEIEKIREERQRYLEYSTKLELYALGVLLLERAKDDQWDALNTAHKRPPLPGKSLQEKFPEGSTVLFRLPDDLGELGITISDLRKFIALDQLGEDRLSEPEPESPRPSENEETSESEETDANGEANAQSELEKSLLRRVRQCRKHYTDSDILNLFLCFTQGFLTIFSGAPGTGKTTICKIMAHALGLDHEHKEEKRFLKLPVEKGWSTKRDLIGYYNPLTRQFDSSSRGLYNSLNLLDQEARNENPGTRPPFAVLLDEANLSPIEHYWSDFIDVCDEILRENVHPELDLGQDPTQQDPAKRIPPYLRFLATINNDHTTEPLSPRVVDRAWVITLPEIPDDDDGSPLDFENEEETVLWQSLKQVFDPQSGPEEEKLLRNNAVWKEICKTARGDPGQEAREKLGLVFSYRSRQAAQRYWAAAVDLFRRAKIKEPEREALDFIVSQKLLPMIDGSGDSYGAALRELEDCVAGYGLSRSEALLKSIRERGEREMYYYRFFA